MLWDWKPPWPFGSTGRRPQPRSRARRRAVGSVGRSIFGSVRPSRERRFVRRGQLVCTHFRRGNEVAQLAVDEMQPEIAGADAELAAALLVERADQVVSELADVRKLAGIERRHHPGWSSVTGDLHGARSSG